MENKIRVTKLNNEVTKTASLSEKYKSNSKKIEKSSELFKKPEHIELISNTFLFNCTKCSFYKAEYFTFDRGALCKKCYTWLRDRWIFIPN